jgi:hypothetical protein
MESIVMKMFLNDFKSAAAEGAVVELKLRMVAGKIPTLREQAHQKQLHDIEDALVEHFSEFLSVDEKESLRLCRQLRNKVLHADFCAARGKLNELGVPTTPGEVRMIRVPIAERGAILDQIQRGVEGTEGVLMADSSMRESGVFGWFIEAAVSKDFQKAANAFIRASEILDRLAAIEDSYSGVGDGGRRAGQ